MAALPNVLMTQSTPRPASPAAAGLGLTADGASGGEGQSFAQGQNFSQGQSFAETVSNQLNAQIPLDSPPTLPLPNHRVPDTHTIQLDTVQTLSFTDIDVADTSATPSTDLTNTGHEPALTLAADDIISETERSVDLTGTIDAPVIADAQTLSTALPVTSVPNAPTSITSTLEDGDASLRSPLSARQDALTASQQLSASQSDIQTTHSQAAELKEQTVQVDTRDLRLTPGLQATAAATDTPASALRASAPLEAVAPNPSLGTLSGTPDTAALKTTPASQPVTTAIPITGELPAPTITANAQSERPVFVPETGGSVPQITAPSQAAAPLEISASTNIPATPNNVSGATDLTPDAQPSLQTSSEVTTPQTPTQTTNAPEILPAKTDGAAASTVPVATPATAAQADAPNPRTDAKDRPLLAERAAETAEYRSMAKNPVSQPDMAKISDAPSNSTTLFASNDSATPLKSVPVFATTSTLTPISGMSDRLAATILQTTNAQPAVTIDKIPQAVVAIALSAKSATLQIDPPELGRIQLDYQFDNQGRTVITLTPESDAARAALLDRMATITAALEQGSNSPVDVKLGDARDFGSEFGQASQEGDGSGPETGSNDGPDGSSGAQTQNNDLQRFTRATAGEPDRLHILV